MSGAGGVDHTAEAFVTFAHELKFSDLSQGAIHAAKRSLIDSIGCAFGCFNADSPRALRHLASQVTATKPATVIGTNLRTAPDYAALTNGAMIRYLDYSDDYFGGAGDIGPHPSDNIGGVLAAAESAGADGRALILGIVIAYEACAQLTDRVNHGGAKPTWDYTTLHAISTSLGAGRVLGLTRQQMRDGLALATVSNITLLQTRYGELSNWKGIAGPNGSRNGLFAAMLAREGITGPEAPFEGKAGWMKHLQMPFELGPFGGGGRPFKVEGIYYKFFPIRYSAQLMVWVALELRETVNVADIASICVYVPKRYVTSRTDAPEHWNPTTRETTDHSFPFLIAAALIDGAINERTFTPECFRHPAILALADKVTMKEDPEFSRAFPEDYKVRFDVTMKSGDVVKLQQANSKGHPRNPMSDSDIEDKFLRQADSLLPRERSRALLAELWQLEKESGFGRLFELMRVP